MRYIGIDPGLSGAFCLLDTEYGSTVADMPTIDTIVNGKKRRQINPYAVRDIIIQFGPTDMVVIEKPATRPGESPIAALSYGIGYGTIIGILVALDRPHQAVRPQVWTKELEVGADKDEHRFMAMRLFPELGDRLARKKDDGRADAALIAYWKHWRHYG